MISIELFSLVLLRCFEGIRRGGKNRTLAYWQEKIKQGKLEHPFRMRDCFAQRCARRRRCRRCSLRSPSFPASSVPGVRILAYLLCRSRLEISPSIIEALNFSFFRRYGISTLSDGQTWVVFLLCRSASTKSAFR